jgi:uncharacterized membrane protein YeaQ/YmgE (transglycosylase-associated protein family)
MKRDCSTNTAAKVVIGILGAALAAIILSIFVLSYLGKPYPEKWTDWGAMIITGLIGLLASTKTEPSNGAPSGTAGDPVITKIDSSATDPVVTTDAKP